MPGDFDTTIVRRLARAYARLLDPKDAVAARQAVADAFAELVPCKQVVVYDVGPPGTHGATGESDSQLVPVVTRGDARGERGATCQSLPLVAHGELLGVVDLVRTGRPFGAAECELAATLADAAAVALQAALARQRLEVLAQTDPLTGLFNHRHFYDRLEGELARTRRTGDPVTLVLVDLDDLKRVNDVYGHAVGDAVLGGLSRMLRSAVRVSDVVCRVGGDEFAVVMPSCGADGALGFASRLVQQLHTTAFPQAGYVTVSCGIATGGTHARSPRELFSCADTALHTAKARGKDRTVVYEDADVSELPGSAPREGRSLAHLKTLQSLAARLGHAREVAPIAEAVVDELRAVLSLHACRVYLYEDFRLRVAGAGNGGCDACDAEDAGEGGQPGGEAVAGAVATRRPKLLTRQATCDGVQGLETVAVVPLTHGPDTVGAVEVVKPGDASLDADDVRLLEVLAGHAAAALVNARLYEEQRREADHAKALVRFGDALAACSGAGEVMERTVAGIAGELGARRASLWVPPCPGAVPAAVAEWGFDPLRRDDELAATRFVVEQALPGLDPAAPLPVSICRVGGGRNATLVLTPLVLEEGRTAVLALVVRESGLPDEKLRLLSGLAGGARLAIAKAFELDQLRSAHARTAEALDDALARLGEDGGPARGLRVA